MCGMFTIRDPTTSYGLNHLFIRNPHRAQSHRSVVWIKGCINIAHKRMSPSIHRSSMATLRIRATRNSCDASSSICSISLRQPFHGNGDLSIVQEADCELGISVEGTTVYGIWWVYLSHYTDAAWNMPEVVVQTVEDGGRDSPVGLRFFRLVCGRKTLESITYIPGVYY